MRNIRMMKLILPVIGCLCVSALFANIKLPALFSDRMVLQRQAKVSFWGWADAGEMITVSNSWSANMVTAKADASGTFRLEIQTPKAGGPYTISIKGHNTIELKDVLIGEVWLCSGQSNMVFSLKSDADARTEIENADYPEIRYFSVNRQYGAQVFDDCPGSEWKATSPQTAPAFSAVAFYFAKRIQQELKIPVGIVYAAWGGTPAEAWTPAEVLQKDSLSVYIDRWKEIQAKVGKDSVNYFAALAKWRMDSTVGKKPAEPQTYYYYKRPWREPAVLFNGMINPVIPYTIKGVLWYQGESNVSYADEYYHLFGSMIESWRKKWNTATKLPFYFVQIASFGYSDMNAAAELREAQYNVMKDIPNTGMAVTVDLGDMKDIHFTHKKKVGERLALIALAKDYGQQKTVYKGPACTKAIEKNGKILLTFTSPGLATAGNKPTGFEIGYAAAGSDSLVFVKAQTELQGNKIIAWSEQRGEPRQIRYAWLLPGEANLFDKQGLPAFPFRKKIGTK